MKSEIRREFYKKEKIKNSDAIKALKQMIKNFSEFKDEQTKKEIKIIKEYIPEKLTKEEVKEMLLILIKEGEHLGQEDLKRLIRDFDYLYDGHANKKEVLNIATELLNNFSNEEQKQ